MKFQAAPTLLLLLLLSARANFSRTSEAEDAMRELLDKYLNGDLGPEGPKYSLNGRLSERDMRTVRSEIEIFIKARTETEKREALEVVVKVLRNAPIYIESCANLLDELLEHCICEEYLAGYCETNDGVSGFLCQETCCHCAEADEDSCLWYPALAIQAACQQETLNGAFWRSNCPELCGVECQVGCAPEVDLPYVNCEFYASNGMCESGVQYFSRFMHYACKDTCNTCSSCEQDDEVCFSPLMEETFLLMPEALSQVDVVADLGSPEGCMTACQDHPECSFWIYKDTSYCIFYNPLDLSAFVPANEGGTGYDMGPRQCGEDCVAEGILFDSEQSFWEVDTFTVDECRNLCNIYDNCFFWTAEETSGPMQCRLYGDGVTGQAYEYTGQNQVYLGPRTCPGE